MTASGAVPQARTRPWWMPRRWCQAQTVMRLGLLAGQAPEVAVEHGGAFGRPEPAAGVCREDVGGDDVRVRGPGSRAGLHT